MASFSLFELTREETTSLAPEWFQWLQPSGLLFLVVVGADDCETTPEMYDSDGECARGTQHRFMHHTVVATLFTKQGWNNLVTRAGFEIVHTDKRLFVPLVEASSSSEMHYIVIARKPVADWIGLLGKCTISPRHTHRVTDSSSIIHVLSQ